MSKVTDASLMTKEGIYRFLEQSKRCAIVVDCENSDPYKLYATLNNLNQNALLHKIAKIILYDDIHTTSAWDILSEFTEIPVEHEIIERVMENKSLVDIRLTTGTCREFFQNDTDSFILASSDSDYWGLIPAMPEAHFLVLIEEDKCSPLIRKAMDDQGITYSYIDDFCTGNSNQIKEQAVLREVQAELDEIVKMVGMDALSAGDRLKMEAARSIREDFLHQNSFHEVDTYTSLKKQHMMMVLVNEFFDRATDALKDGASLQKLISMPVREQIGRFKYVTEDKLDEEFKQVDETLSAQIAAAFVKEEG